ncbi:hydroxymethylglutaryl-CoA reductase [Patescibacteria group bacterium]|nr:hydroxymethylglutaryl-CoA reductase [Patescibacteria group bacterium]MBU2036343.1 hydroxymethylglutaryl-CoA reductase [Patescibacteria group bacterium]
MKKTQYLYKNINKTILTENTVKGNCENFIGATQVPLGLAGPLKIYLQNIKGKAQKKEIMIPLSTTEGALVASINRGLKATYISKGIKTYVENVGVTRGPLFRVKNIKEAQKITLYIEKNINKLKKIARNYSPHINLLKVNTQFVGKNLWLRLYFDTSEAMGMNMVTYVSEVIALKVQNDLKVKCTSLSGNFCSDKKPSWSNFILGRGKKVWAETVIKKNIVERVLKTQPKKIVEIVKNKSQLGSIITGSLGFNAHFANIIAALYLSLGQDLGHIAEGSMGITDAEVEDNGDLYFSVFMPDIMVGTVGGGTKLPTQKEALNILGVGNKKGDSLILSQIIAATVLAGELSLSAALASGDLAKSHKKLTSKKND